MKKLSLLLVLLILLACVFAACSGNGGKNKPEGCDLVRYWHGGGMPPMGEQRSTKLYATEIFFYPSGKVERIERAYDGTILTDETWYVSAAVFTELINSFSQKDFFTESERSSSGSGLIYDAATRELYVHSAEKTYPSRSSVGSRDNGVDFFDLFFEKIGVE